MNEITNEQVLALREKLKNKEQLTEQDLQLLKNIDKECWPLRFAPQYR